MSLMSETTEHLPTAKQESTEDVELAINIPESLKIDTRQHRSDQIPSKAYKYTKTYRKD